MPLRDRRGPGRRGDRDRRRRSSATTSRASSIRSTRPSARAARPRPCRCAGTVRYRGALVAGCRTGDRTLGEDELLLMAELADLAAAALEHSESRRQFDDLMKAHVEALAAAMDMRDRRTAAHSEDVVRLASAGGPAAGARGRVARGARVRGAPSRRGQDPRPRRRAPQARSARRGRVRGHPLPRGVGRRRRSPGYRASRRWPPSCASTTSAGTAPATPTGWRAPASRSPAGSSAPATRSPP